MALSPYFVTSTGTDTWANSAVYTTPCSLSTAITNATAGDLVWILSGTYTRSADDTFANAGTVGSPVIFRGCSTFGTGTPTPIPYSRTNGVGALVVTNMPVIAYDSTYKKNGTETYVIYESLVFTGTRAGYLLATFGLYCSIANCSVTNASNNVGAGCVASALRIYHCDLINSNATQSAYVFSGLSTHMVNCRLQNASATCSGIMSIGSRSSILRCQLLASTGVGVNISSNENVMIDSCTIYSQGVAAIRTPNSAQIVTFTVSNCNLTDNAQALLNLYNATAAHPVIWFNNRTRDNVAADLGFGDWPNNCAVTTDNGNYTTDYVDATTGDFRLAAAAVSRNAALNSGDIGACQRVENYPAATVLLDSTTCDSEAVVGTYHAPDVGEVTSNAVFGPASVTSGTYHRPETNEVIDTANFGIASGQTGTVHQASAEEVIDTAVFGPSSVVAGTVHQPDVGEVTSNAVFGPSSGLAGTYHGPETAEVIDTASFGITSGQIGTVHQPDVGEVTSNAVFGPSSGLTGTYHRPEVAEVIDSASFGITSGQTGTVHQPDVGEVTSNAVFGPGSLLTGIYHRPETSEVIDTASFGISSGQSGTVHQPDVGEVISNAVFGPSSGLTGTYHRPETNEVIDTAVFGISSGQTGTIHQPEAAEVIDTAHFGAGSIVAGTVHQPDQTEVISTAAYGPSSVTPGTYHEATASEVQKNVVFGPASGYTGLYDPVTGNYTDPGKANVIKTNDYIFAGASQVAEFDEAARNTDPTEAKVETGTSYKILNVAKNGNYPTTATSKAEQLVTDKAEVTSKKDHIENTQTILTIDGTLDLAAAEAAAAAAQLVTDKAAVDTDKSSILNTATILTITGTFDEAARNTDPGEANVKLGEEYIIAGVSLEGELVVSGGTGGGGGNIFGGAIVTG